MKTADSWGAAAKVVTIQLTLGVGAAAACLFSPLGGGLAVLALALGLVVGAWIAGRRWSLRLADDRALARRLARRTGALHGASVGVAYGALAVTPGQVDATGAILVALTAVLAVAGGLTGAALTLCGVDLQDHDRTA